MQWREGPASGGVNAAVANATATHGLNYVAGVFDSDAPHGYCSGDHWLVRVHEAFIRQAESRGMLHPNRAGRVLHAPRRLPDQSQSEVSAAPRVQA